MAYYDTIARRWHEATGYKGGAFKELVLNNILLEKLGAIHDKSILELGAGNGYFLPLALRRFSGQVPSQIVVSDNSTQLLEIAKRYFRLPGAVYKHLDVCKPFPVSNNSVDLIIASMVLNELPSYCFENALNECYRTLTNAGVFLIAVTHPFFITSLQKRELLKTLKGGLITMPGAGSLRLPVISRSLETYRLSLQKAGFNYEETEAFPSKEVLNLKAGLRNAGNVPVALIYKCTKTVNNKMVGL